MNRFNTEDVFRFYLGCPLRMMAGGKDKGTWWDRVVYRRDHKIILNHLSDFNDDKDVQESIKAIYDNPNFYDLPELAAELVVYLTNKRIDLFGLIERGEAVDAKTMKVKDKPSKCQSKDDGVCSLPIGSCSQCDR